MSVTLNKSSYLLAFTVSTWVSTLSFSAGASEGTDGILTTLDADNLVVVQKGELVYQAHCASCHGEQLEGQPNWRSRNQQGLLPVSKSHQQSTQPPRMPAMSPGMGSRIPKDYAVISFTESGEVSVYSQY